MQILAATHRAGGGLFVLYGLVFFVAAIVAAAKILSKAGYSPWYCLLLLIPIVNLIMLLVFAFSDWPVDKELRRYREGGYGPGPGGYPAPQWSGQPAPGYGPPGGPTPNPGWAPPPSGWTPPPQAPPSATPPPAAWQPPPPETQGPSAPPGS
jgi:hypothetical protein